MKRLLLIAFLVFVAPTPAHASLQDLIKKLWVVCGQGPTRFKSDTEAAWWLYRQMGNLHLTSLQRHMLEQWPTSGVSTGINEDIRAGREPKREGVLDSFPDSYFTRGDLLDLMTSIHSRNKLSRPIITFRGIGEDDIPPGAKVGDVITEIGYMNLSLTRTTPDIWGKYYADKYGTRGHTMLELELPAGVAVAPVGRVGPEYHYLTDQEIYGGELCVVPPRGTKFKITEISTDARGVRHVKGIVVP